MKLSWEEMMRNEAHRAYIQSLSLIDLLKMWVKR